MKLHQFLQIVALVFVLTFMWFLAHAQGQYPATPPELHFYQIEPVCANKVPAYLVMTGTRYTAEMHKVWVCGYRR